MKFYQCQGKLDLTTWIHLSTFQKEKNAFVLSPAESAASCAVFLLVSFSLVVQPVTLVKAKNCWYLLYSAFIYRLSPSVRCWQLTVAVVLYNNSRSLRPTERSSAAGDPSPPSQLNVSPGWTVSRCSLPVLGSCGRLARRRRRAWTAAVRCSHKSTFRPGQWRAERPGCVLPLCLSLSRARCLSALRLLCWLSHPCCQLHRTRSPTAPPRF